MKTHTLKKLLDESLISYYWLGFLVADGHFSKVNRLKITTSIKDKLHIIKYSEYINVPYIIHSQGKYEQITVVVMDTKIVKELKNLLKISNIKTKIPVDLSKLSKDELTAFKIGFIDGDGNIQYQTNRTDVMLQIKCFHTWENNLELMFGNCKITNAGYALSIISDNTTLRQLKLFALQNNLPILERKWNKIDENRVSRYVITAERVKILKTRLKEKIRKGDIAKELGVSPSCISNLIKRNNI